MEQTAISQPWKLVDVINKSRRLHDCLSGVEPWKAVFTVYLTLFYPQS